jgi:hypothetical protein
LGEVHGLPVVVIYFLGHPAALTAVFMASEHSKRDMEGFDLANIVKVDAVKVVPAAADPGRV